ncbi:unnamed protein product [Ambrosiozyma monospora]|uniref:Unnamed protein product n=1 Tax=Ambrosiozyma monospora TaxID=43982 RepID=A0ACB5U2R1_AMBMO|nr:unnamed protein product [Ambrosiozyma monospora]
MIDVTEKAKDVFSKVHVRNCTFSIGSPYLNKHGEVAGGLIGSGDSGTLNPGRYDHLNKAWLSQNIISSTFKQLFSHFARYGIRDMPETFQNMMRRFTTNMTALNDEPMVNPLNATRNLNPAFFMNPENNGLGSDDDDENSDEDDGQDDQQSETVTIPAGLRTEDAQFILNALLNGNFIANTEPPEALDDDSE